MNRILAVGWLAAGYLFVQGCAHPASTVAEAVPMAEVAPAEGQSAVVVYRSVTGAAGTMSVTLLVDGVAVGDLSRETYGVIDLSPGRHVITARSGTGESKLIVTADAGAVHFVQLETSPAPRMSPRDAQVARVEIATDCSFAFRQSAAPVQAQAPKGNGQT